MTIALTASLALLPSRHVYIPAWDSCSGENCRVLVKLLPITVAIGVAPEGSESLFVPKNQSKFGVGVSFCVSTVAEHTREKLVPAIPVLDPPEAVMVNGPMFTVLGEEIMHLVGYYV